jgi:hypothetical protein
MKIVRKLTDDNGRIMNLSLCRKNGIIFIFKEIKSPFAIEYELLFQKLAKRLSMPILKSIKKGIVNGKNGFFMSYLTDATLLCHHKKKLTKQQKRELQRIILLDILVANKDRHTANVFLNKHLIPLDHDRILNGKERPASAFVKIGIGRMIDTNYVDKLENIGQKGKVSTKSALLDYFRFKQKDLDAIRSLKDIELSAIVSSLKLPNKEKLRILSFLKYRRDNFYSLKYF